MRNHLKQLQRVWSSPGNRGNRLCGLLRATWWTLRSRISPQPVKRKVFSKRRIWCHPDRFVSRSIMLFGEWVEYDSLKLLQGFLRPADSFLDVGANVGLFTLLASETLPPKAIYCVEPGGLQRSRLVDNLELNGFPGVHIFPCAVGESDGVVSFTKGDAVAHVMGLETGPAEMITESVTVRRLDDFLPRKVFQFSKIDVEGFELHALQGAKGLMDDGLMPVILIEVNGSSERYGIQSADIFAYLGRCGYQLGIYSHDQKTIFTTGRLWDDVVAFNDAGRRLIRERLPEIRIV